MPDTIKVRIALEIAPDGNWVAYGYKDARSWKEAMEGIEGFEDDTHTARHWINAEVAVPSAEPETLKGEAVPA